MWRRLTLLPNTPPHPHTGLRAYTLQLHCPAQTNLVWKNRNNLRGRHVHSPHSRPVIGSERRYLREVNCSSKQAALAKHCQGLPLSLQEQLLAIQQPNV